jgi:hypothetical protein
MIDFISLNSSKLGPEFIDNELIGFVPISVIENHRVAKVHSIRKEILNRENIFNVGFGLIINIFAEEDRRLLKIRNLAREMRKVLKNSFDGLSLVHRGTTTEDQIISKKERVDGRTTGAWRYA